MNKGLLLETNKRGRRRWLRVDEGPFSRVFCYKLIDLGLVDSVLLRLPGSKKGIRLIDGDSLDQYLEKLAAEQKTRKTIELAEQEAEGIGT
jgi:hypothetical protein